MLTGPSPAADPARSDDWQCAPGCARVVRARVEGPAGGVPGGQSQQQVRRWARCRGGATTRHVDMVCCARRVRYEGVQSHPSCGRCTVGLGGKPLCSVHTKSMQTGCKLDQGLGQVSLSLLSLATRSCYNVFGQMCTAPVAPGQPASGFGSCGEAQRIISMSSTLCRRSVTPSVRCAVSTLLPSH